ncbi:MAG: hypothetical protein WCK86_22760, partial [Planctomycetia bacterium]
AGRCRKRAGLISSPQPIIKNSGHIMPPRLGLKRTTEAGKTSGVISLWARQDTFETEALEKTEPMTRRLYLQHSARQGKAFELYRKVILQSHFLKTHQL